MKIINTKEKIILAEQKRVRAVIIEDDKVLLIHRIKDDREYWVFPGGSVEKGESFEEAVIRETKEELGVDVKIRKVFTFTEEEIFYNCEIISGNLGEGQGPEFQSESEYRGEYKIEWISINNIYDYDVFPKEVKNELMNRKGEF
ncbi:MAG: NUDIX domain-containing protein [Candidatus Nealsonbacteria bacterium]